MVTTVNITEYKCSICNTVYSSEEGALSCEAKPITQDKGVKVNDIVKVTSGDGVGELAKVKNIFIINNEWGHYAAQKYYHTVAIEVDFIESYGSRLLTFDSYEVI